MVSSPLGVTMTLIDSVGLAAALLSTASFVPQVVKTLSTRDTTSISLLMYTLFLLGIFCWLTWSFLLGQWTAMTANAITGVLASVVFALKVHAVVVKKEKP
jgi:MtN3 and saliva related transmembrane protein